MTNFIKKNWQKLVLIVSVLITPLFLTYAAQDPNCAPGTICNPLGTTNTIPALIKLFLEGALKIGIPIVALAIIYAGFLFVAARGNSEKLGKAKDTLLYTLIGAAILLGAWAIAQIISSTVTSLGS